MRKIVAASIAFSIAALFTATEANAQINSGFGFGVGIGQAGIGARFPGFANFGTARRRAGLPYFAQHPPVYYSGIVRRPYGISPFAAPAGIRPVELDVAPVRVNPVKIVNPYAKGVQPISGKEVKKKAGMKNRSAKVVNPFFNHLPESQSITRHASFEELAN